MRNSASILKRLAQLEKELETIHDPDEPLVFLSFVDTGNDQVTERLRDRLEEDPKNKRQKIFIVYEETYEQYGLIKVIDPTDPSLSAWHDVGKGLKERLEKQIQQPISQQEKDQKLSTLKEKIVEVKKRVKVEKDASVLLLKFHFTSKWIVTEGKSQGPEQSNKITHVIPDPEV